MKYLFFVALLILFTSNSFPAFSIQLDADFYDSPVERAPASQSEVQDIVGEQLTHALVDQQILVVADVTNALDRQQPFAYIVQIEDETGAVLSLGWLTGSLSPNQVLSPALSWTPKNPGTYHVTIFVWEGIDNPTALSHPLELEIEVRLAEG